MTVYADIDRMDDRLDAVEQALVAALPTRVVRRSWLREFDAYSEADLLRGVVCLISAGEREYQTGPGRNARGGVHRMLLIAYLKVEEQETPQAIERAELDLAEEIKAAVRAGAPGVGLSLVSIEHSRQLEHPYGWVVVHLDAGPQKSNVR